MFAIIAFDHCHTSLMFYLSLLYLFFCFIFTSFYSTFSGLFYVNVVILYLFFIFIYVFNLYFLSSLNFCLTFIVDFLCECLSHVLNLMEP